MAFELEPSWLKVLGEEFEKDYIQFLTLKHRDVLDALKAGKFDDNITNVLEAAAKEISAKY